MTVRTSNVARMAKETWPYDFTHKAWREDTNWRLSCQRKCIL